MELEPHLQRKVVEGGVMRAGAAAKTKLLLVRRLCRFLYQAGHRDLTTLIRSAGDASEVGWSD